MASPHSSAFPGLRVAESPYNHNSQCICEDHQSATTATSITRTPSFGYSMSRSDSTSSFSLPQSGDIDPDEFLKAFEASLKHPRSSYNHLKIATGDRACQPPPSPHADDYNLNDALRYECSIAPRQFSKDRPTGKASFSVA